MSTRPCVRCKHFFNDDGYARCHRLERTSPDPVYGSVTEVFGKDARIERFNEPEHRGPNYCGPDGQFFEPTLLHRFITMLRITRD